MGTTLTGTTPQDTYDSLIKVTNNGPLSSTARYLSDGLGNDSVLALSTSRVGIGTTSPDTALDVNGGSKFRGSISGFGGAEILLNAGNNSQVALSTNGTGTTEMYFDQRGTATGIWRFRDTTDTRMSLTSVGLGIGTSSPARLLHSSASYVAPTGGIDSNVQILASNTSGASGINMLASNGSVSFLHFGDTDAANVGQIAYTHANDNMLFVVGGAERFRMTPNGLTFNGDTAAANALDDYEEGTWTPTISFGGASVGVTYAASRAGQYTKIGRQVTATAYILLTNKGTSTGAASIGGLPYTIGGSSGFYSSACFSAISQLSYVGMLQGYGEINTNRIDLVETTEAGSQTVITDADFTNVSQVLVQFTYFV